MYVFWMNEWIRGYVKGDSPLAMAGKTIKMIKFDSTDEFLYRAIYSWWWAAILKLLQAIWIHDMIGFFSASPPTQNKNQDEHFAIFTFIIFIVINMFFLHLIIIIQKRSMPSSYNCWDIKYGCVLYCVLCIVFYCIVKTPAYICVFDCGQYVCVCIGAGQTHKIIRSNILQRIYSMRCKNVTDKIPLYKMAGTKVAIGPFP